MSKYQFTPWRLKFSSRDGWEVWTKRDRALGSRNNYAVATGIQNEDEGRVLSLAPELAEALRAIVQWHEGPAINPPKDLWPNVRALLARLEGGEK